MHRLLYTLASKVDIWITWNAFGEFEGARRWRRLPLSMTLLVRFTGDRATDLNLPLGLRQAGAPTAETDGRINRRHAPALTNAGAWHSERVWWTARTKMFLFLSSHPIRSSISFPLSYCPRPPFSEPHVIGLAICLKLQTRRPSVSINFNNHLILILLLIRNQQLKEASAQSSGDGGGGSDGGRGRQHSQC